MNSGVILDFEALIRSCQVYQWSGSVWRTHSRIYAADDPGGSIKRSGRYHRAPDIALDGRGWTALYTTLSPETSLGEVLRHTPPVLMARLNTLRLTEFFTSLTVVIDLRGLQSIDVIGVSMLDNSNYTITQQLAQAALTAGAEAIFVPSATRLGDNLVIFPDHLRPESRLEVIGSRDPMLYVERT